MRSQSRFARTFGIISQGRCPKHHPRLQRVVARCIVSELVEPPLDSNVVERPCSLLLIEDDGIYQNSWRQQFLREIPSSYGMSVGFLSVSENLPVDTFEQRVEILKQDLATFNDGVLVARGPIASWSALLYLESLSLQGLVMVDPIPFDRKARSDQEATQTLKSVLKRKGLEVSGVFQQLENISNGFETRALKLEPNSVPMLVLQTLEGELFSDACRETARRHSDPDGPFGDAELRDMLTGEDTNEVITTITSWIDEIVL